jgi:eukaryotic-like serine/threonine-protein kinase
VSGNESKIPVGTLLVGKYRVVREIGRGGMAAVYEAEQLSLGKRVAVKVLAAELSASTIVIERFFREARAAASVKSPYIVDVYDSGRLDDGRPFITMELLEGESLYDRMARVRLIDIETTARVIVHTARGLMKAHQAGIVHRDLKPENIFLTKGEDGDDVCKILDFGLAKFYAPVNPEEKAAKRLTREGAVFGTPAYMSPEQVKGQGNVDHRADLWALGCMAYECLIGRPVWNMDQGVAMTFAAIATGPIPVPSQQRSDLPPAFDEWFKKCLERDPARRFQGAKELADAFVEAWSTRAGSQGSYPNVIMPAATGSHRVIGGGGTLEGQAVITGSNPAIIPGLTGPFPVGNGALPTVTSSDTALPLVTRSSTDVPTTMSRPERPATPLRYALASAFLLGGLAGAIFVYVRFLGPQMSTTIVKSTTQAPSASASTTTRDVPPPNEPSWVPMIAEGQKLFASGDLAGAQRKFGHAAETGVPAAVAAARVFSEQARFAEKPTGGVCRLAAFARPRLATERKAERPSIAPISKGALVTWIDDHERPNTFHAYGVVIDPTGKSLSPIRDLTPDAAEANRPQLANVGTDKLVLLYWDEKGREAGVRARLLDGTGNIDQYKGQVVRVGGTRPGQFWPAIDKGPEGFWVVWQDDRDQKEDHDLFVRHLSNDLETLTAETRLTDYVAPTKSKFGPARVRYPSVAVSANTLLVAYRLENDKDKSRSITRMRVPLNEAEKGLEESKDAARGDRVFGDVSMISEERVPADSPSIACGNEGCFVVWHVEAGGASIAKIDPIANKVLWRKKLSDKGGHPSLGVHEGQVAVAWYEKPLMKFTVVNDAGPVLPGSAIVRMHDPNAPRPSIAPGSGVGEWLVTWQDADQPKGNAEIYAARLSCK